MNRITDRLLVVVFLAVVAIVALAGAIAAHASATDLLAIMGTIVGVLVPSPLSKTATAPDPPA